MTYNPLETYNASNPQSRVFDLSDKLKIINEALINTGNNPVNVNDDSSDEWLAANNAFEQNVLYLLGARDWNFSTATAQLMRLGDSSYPGYSDVFAKPADCLQLVNVWRNDDAEHLNTWTRAFGHAMADVRPPDLTYSIIGDNVHTKAPKGVTAKYTQFPQGAQDWSTGFVACLRAKIEANLYRSLNEDINTAGAWEQLAEKLLKDAIARNASEDSPKVMFKSKLQKARMVRRFGWYLR
jgi:hypothetical protein